MKLNEFYCWFIQSEGRKKILLNFNQPLTATQITQRVDISLDSFIHFLWGLKLHDLLYCLNSSTSYSKLYWLTDLGKAVQQKLRKSLAMEQVSHYFPNINWDIYSSICYSQRSAVIKAINDPMIASEIKRKATTQNPEARISSSNVRDALKYLCGQDIVHKFRIRKKNYLIFELTELGMTFKELLVGAKIF